MQGAIPALFELDALVGAGAGAPALLVRCIIVTPGFRPGWQIGSCWGFAVIPLERATVLNKIRKFLAAMASIGHREQAEFPAIFGGIDAIVLRGQLSVVGIAAASTVGVGLAVHCGLVTRELLWFLWF